MTTRLQPFRLISYHTFFSYRYADLDLDASFKLAHLLQKQGLRPWLDKDEGQYDLAPRSSSDPRGRQRISNDDEVVKSKLFEVIRQSLFITVISSAHTLSSVWVRREIEMAYANNQPLYFWHVVSSSDSIGESKADSASLPPSGLWPSNIESVGSHNKSRPLPDNAHVEFSSSLSSKKDLNRIGHKVSPVSDVASVATQIQSLIELAEIIVNKGNELNANSIEEEWPYYDSLRRQADVLYERIRKAYGRSISVGRVPNAEFLGFKKPFALARVTHLQRLLDDESFRKQELGV
jgi:hypothetical protein